MEHWKKLDRVICDALTFYALGLRCPIRLAMIDLLSVDDHYHTADALRDNPVSRLQLTLDHDLSMFGALFSPEVAKTLTHLTVCLLYSNSFGSIHSTIRWDDVLVCYRTSDAVAGLFSLIMCRFL